MDLHTEQCVEQKHKNYVKFYLFPEKIYQTHLFYLLLPICEASTKKNTLTWLQV